MHASVSVAVLCRQHVIEVARGVDARAIDHHSESVDELDVQGILAFAERILPRASDLWVQASLDYKQRLQQLFFPEGIAFDGNRFNRTAATAPLFKYLAPSESADEKMVSRLGIEPRTRRLRVVTGARKCQRVERIQWTALHRLPSLGIATQPGRNQTTRSFMPRDLVLKAFDCLLPVAVGRGGARNGLAVHLDRADVNPSACTVTAAGN